MAVRVEAFCLANRPERSAILISSFSDDPVVTKWRRRDINQDSAKTEIWSESFFQSHVINPAKRRFTAAPPEAPSV